MICVLLIMFILLVYMMSICPLYYYFTYYPPYVKCIEYRRILSLLSVFCWGLGGGETDCRDILHGSAYGQDRYRLLLGAVPPRVSKPEI